jgi:hypothetical protein
MWEEYEYFVSWICDTHHIFLSLSLLSIATKDVSDGIGKEVITKYTTPMATNQYFYTDANGLEIQQRRRNFRPTWPFQNTEPAVSLSLILILILILSSNKKIRQKAPDSPNVGLTGGQLFPSEFCDLFDR